MYLLYVERTVTWVLVFVIWHHLVLIPDANNDCILGSSYCSTTTSSSGHVCCICFWIMLSHHKFLVTHSNASCRWIPLAFSHTQRTIEFNDLQVFCWSIFQFLWMFIFIEPWPIWRCDPTRTIESIDSSVLTHIGLKVFVLLVRIRILNSPDVGVPAVRHKSFPYNYNFD